MKHLSLLALALGLTTTVSAQTSILNETFNTGIPATWTIVIEDSNTVHPDVNDFAAGWIAMVDPDNNTDTVAGSTSYFTTPAQASRWLITPPLALGGYGNILRWEGKAHDPSYADGYLVLVSTTDSQLSSFTDTLRIVAEESENWLQREINLSDSGYVNQTIYLAFVNKSYDKFKLYLDDFSVTINDPLGLNDVVAMQWTLYPNPVQHELHIQTDEQVTNMQIKSVGGQQIYSGEFCATYAVTDLTPGVYFLHLETATGNAIKRFVKY